MLLGRIATYTFTVNESVLGAILFPSKTPVLMGSSKWDDTHVGIIFRELRPQKGGLVVDASIQVSNFNTYCWWKKSCTTWCPWSPMKNGIFSIWTGAGFLPSTVLFQNHQTFIFTRIHGSGEFNIVKLTIPLSRQNLPLARKNELRNMLMSCMYLQCKKNACIRYLDVP